MVLERLYGRHAVEAALLSRKRNLIKLSLCNTLEHGSRKRPTLEQMRLEKIVQRAADIGVPVERTTRSWLDSMAKDRPHQNLILTAHPLDRKTIQPKELGPGTFVMLDGLKDPQNIGAIMRSAYFLGASGILLHKVKTLGPTVSKASSGVLEAWDSIWNIEDLDFPASCRLLAASLQSCALPVLDVNQPLVRHAQQIVVLGSEHDGVSKRVLDRCHARICIPAGSNGPFALDSLNVSVAAGIILNRLCA